MKKERQRALDRFVTVLDLFGTQVGRSNAKKSPTRASVRVRQGGQKSCEKGGLESAFGPIWERFWTDFLAIFMGFRARRISLVTFGGGWGGCGYVLCEHHDWGDGVMPSSKQRRTELLKRRSASLMALRTHGVAAYSARLSALIWSLSKTRVTNTGCALLRVGRKSTSVSATSCTAARSACCGVLWFGGGVGVGG